MRRRAFSWAVLRLNAVFFGGLLLWTGLYFPCSLLAYLWQTRVRGVPVKRAIRGLAHCYGRVCCKLLASQIPLRVENRAGDVPSPCIIVANHQSFFDPYCIGFFPLPNQVYVVRAWPFRIPLYGRIMRRAGYVNSEVLDQEALFREAGQALNEGAALVVFPEGTRSPTGELGRFHAGAFKLAVEHKVPIVPLCIDGAGRVFPKGSRLGKPAPMRVTLLPPVYPQEARDGGKLPHRCLQREVKLAIQTELHGAQAGG
jgi:1-acyl-sn-glycerol-3-phosphate acyltransferase